MAISTTIKKGVSTYTVYTSGGIIKNALLYTTSALTTLWTANYGRFTFGAGNLEYCDINQSSTVTERFYSFPTFGNGDTLYAKVPIELPGIIGQTLYNDLLYWGNPLKPVTTNGNWTSANGLVLLETANSNGTIIALKEAPFITFNSFTSTSSAVQADRNGKIGVKLNVLVGEGFGGTPPFSVVTGSGIIYSELSSGPILQFDDWRVSGTRTARISDSFTAISFFNIPTIQYISNASYYPYVFGSNGSIVITPNIPAADYAVQPKYRIVDIQSGQPISYQWSVTPSFTGIPLKNVYLEVQDQYGTWFQTTLIYTAEEPPEPPIVVPVTASFNRIESTLSANQADRNNNIGSVFNISGGTPPYSVTTGGGSTVTNVGSGPIIKFDDVRNSSTRSTKFYDSLNASVYVNNPTVQYIANPDYYAYTFTSDGTVTVTPSIPVGATYNVTVEYRLHDIEANYPIGGWVTTPTWYGVPLKTVVLQIKDQYGSYLEKNINYVSSVMNVYWNFINQSVSTIQADRNNNANFNFQIIGGTPPYRVESVYGSVQLGSNEFVNFDFGRIVGSRLLRFKDSLDHLAEFTNYTAKYTADPSYYSNYTFTTSTGLVVTPNIPSTQIYNTITVTYRLQDIDTGQYISTAQSVPTFPDAPLKDVYMEVRDILGSFIKLTMVYTPEDIPEPIMLLGNLSFVNDPMVSIDDSSLKLSKNMKYTYTMFDNNDDELLKTTVYPDVENNYYGIYNMNMVYKNYVTSKCNYNINNIIVTDNVYNYTYNVNDNTSSTGTTSDVKYCLKGGTEYGEYFSFTEYICEASENHKFLSKWKGNRLLRSDDYGVINYLNGNFNTVDITSGITHIAFVKYNYGENVHTFTNDDSWYHDPNRTNYIPVGIINTEFSNKLLTIPYGTLNFKSALTLTNVIDDDGNVIYTNILENITTEFYEVHLVKKTGSVFTKMSESIVVDLNKNEECLKYIPTRFIWLDMYGNYNTFTFNGLNTKEYSIDRNSVNNDYFKVTNTDTWGYDFGDRGRRTINVKKIESHNAISGWLNDDMSENLMYLYTSSDAYVIINNNLYPIIITTNSVEQKSIKNNRLFNHSISYEMAYDINTND